MALKIRLRQQGRTNRQTYRLVVADIRSPRDGKYIEMLGWYNPFAKEGAAEINLERINYWLSQGAQVSDQVKNLLAQKAPLALKELTAKSVAKRQKLCTKRKARLKRAVAKKKA